MMEGRLINSRESAKAYALEQGLGGRVDENLLILLNSDSRLLGSHWLRIESEESLNAGNILRHILNDRASGFLLVRLSDKEPSQTFRKDVSELITLSRDFGIHFIDYLSVSGLTVHSLVWDRARKVRSAWGL